MHADFDAMPYGELQINVKNINCFNQSDNLSNFRTHSIPDYYDDVPNPAIYVGCIDNIGNMNKSPMGWYKYKGKVIRNGIETTRSEEHTSELQSRPHLVCRLLLEKKKEKIIIKS